MISKIDHMTRFEFSGISRDSVNAFSENVGRVRVTTPGSELRIEPGELNSFSFDVFLSFENFVE